MPFQKGRVTQTRWVPTLGLLSAWQPRACPGAWGVVPFPGPLVPEQWGSRRQRLGVDASTCPQSRRPSVVGSRFRSDVPVKRTEATTWERGGGGSGRPSERVKGPSSLSWRAAPSFHGIALLPGRAWDRAVGDTPVTSVFCTNARQCSYTAQHWIALRSDGWGDTHVRPNAAHRGGAGGILCALARRSALQQLASALSQAPS